MERKVVLYIAESLDGYIATKDDSLEWLLSVEGEGDNGYGEFYNSVDTIIMGRRTYDWIIEHENGNFPYIGKQCYVYSTKPRPDDSNAEFISNDIKEFIRTLKKQDGKKIWLVGGSQLISSFRHDHLIDEYIVSIAPVILGEGIPLFSPKEKEDLRLERVRQFGQFVEITYSKK